MSNYSSKLNKNRSFDKFTDDQKKYLSAQRVVSNIYTMGDLRDIAFFSISALAFMFSIFIFNRSIGFLDNVSESLLNIIN